MMIMMFGENQILGRELGWEAFEFATGCIPCTSNGNMLNVKSVDVLATELKSGEVEEAPSLHCGLLTQAPSEGRSWTMFVSVMLYQ